MRSDELRRELQQLADELEPFTPDAVAVHRSVRRRRAARSAVAAAVAVLLVGLAASAVWRGGRDAAVTSSRKEYAAFALHRLDVLVVPGSVSAQRALEQSALVGRYTAIARGALPPSLGGLKVAGLADASCALQHHAGFVVESALPDRDITSELQKELGGSAKVYDISRGHSADVEVFMKVTAPATDVEAVRRAISEAPNIRSVRFLDHQDAYAEYAQVFKDQPALVQSTKPDALPESFRILVADGADPSGVGAQFEHMPGVDAVITHAVANILELGRFLGRQVTGSDAEIFMKLAASPSEVRALADALSHDARVEAVTFIDHENALREFQKIFHDQPALLKNTSAQQLPESFRVKLRDTNVDQWSGAYQARPGVDTVTKNQGRPVVEACKGAS